MPLHVSYKFLKFYLILTEKSYNDKLIKTQKQSKIFLENGIKRSQMTEIKI